MLTNKANWIHAVDQGTLEWWAKQDEKIRNEAPGDEDRVQLTEFVRQLNKWCVGLDELWWPKVPLFDYAILQNLYAQLNTSIPGTIGRYVIVEHYLVCYPEDPETTQMDLHNALADCYFQAKSVPKGI